MALRQYKPIIKFCAKKIKLYYLNIMKRPSTEYDIHFTLTLVFMSHNHFETQRSQLINDRT